MSPVPAPDAPRVRIASMIAALAFVYALFITLVLMLISGFFADEGNQRTILAWLTVPVLATFWAWMAVRSGHAVLRVAVWALVLVTLFFCWLTIFDIGVYFLPAPFLMIMAALGPWDGESTGEEGQAGSVSSD